MSDQLASLLPLWVIEKLRALGPSYFGKMILIYEHGAVVRIEKNESIIPVFVRPQLRKGE